MTPSRTIPRAALVASAVAASVGWAAGARAQGLDSETLSSHHKIRESPQHFAVELRFSPFVPDIDSDPKLAGNKPYGNVFGTSPQLLAAAEFDWQAARIPHVGTVGPGLGIGYSTMTANARFVAAHNGQFVSGETTTLQIVPMHLVGVLRADALWREAHVPLVPYAKLGLGLAFWRASNTLGTSNFQGVSGVGHSWGTELALGLGFNLNVLDEYAARNFDESVGVNGTYLFAEWTRSDLSGLFAAGDVLRVGGTYWTFGLTFEF
jgi:hypothetical protein